MKITDFDPNDIQIEETPKTKITDFDPNDIVVDSEYPKEVEPFVPPSYPEMAGQAAWNTAASIPSVPGEFIKGAEALGGQVATGVGKFMQAVTPDIVQEFVGVPQFNPAPDLAQRIGNMAQSVVSPQPVEEPALQEAIPGMEDISAAGGGIVDFMATPLKAAAYLGREAGLPATEWANEWEQQVQANPAMAAVSAYLPLKGAKASFEKMKAKTAPTMDVPEEPAITGKGMPRNPDYVEPTVPPVEPNGGLPFANEPARLPSPQLLLEQAKQEAIPPPPPAPPPSPVPVLKEQPPIKTEAVAPEVAPTVEPQAPPPSFVNLEQKPVEPIAPTPAAPSVTIQPTESIPVPPERMTVGSQKTPQELLNEAKKTEVDPQSLLMVNENGDIVRPDAPYSRIKTIESDVNFQKRFEEKGLNKNLTQISGPFSKLPTKILKQLSEGYDLNYDAVKKISKYFNGQWEPQTYITISGINFPSNGSRLGTIGDVLKGPDAVKNFEAIKDTPIVITKKYPAIMDSSAKHEPYGWTDAKGTRIFIHADSAKNINLRQLKEIITHEATHIRQLKEGLKYESDMPYKERPSEIEAYDVGKKYRSGKLYSNPLDPSVLLNIGRLFKSYKKPTETLGQKVDVRIGNAPIPPEPPKFSDILKRHLDEFVKDERGSLDLGKLFEFFKKPTIKTPFEKAKIVDKPNMSAADAKLDTMSDVGEELETRLKVQADKSKPSFMDNFMTETYDKAMPILKHMSGINLPILKELTMKNTPLEEKTMNAIQRRSYSGAMLEGYMNRHLGELVPDMIKRKISLDKLKKYLTVNRMLTERKGIENFLTLKEAQEWMDAETKNGTIPDLEALKQSMNKRWQEDVIEPLINSDLVDATDPKNAEMIKTLRTNEDYVPFLGIDKMEGEYGSREYAPGSGIYYQKGSKQGVRDVLAAKLAKGAAIKYDILNNKTIVDIVDFFRQTIPGIFKESTVRFIPELKSTKAEQKAILNNPALTDAQKVLEIENLMKQPGNVIGGYYDYTKPPETSGMEPVRFREKGQPKEVYFPRDIARAINEPFGKGVYLAGINEYNAFWKKLWIDYSPPFIQKNIVRDFANSILQVPGLTDKARFVKLYGPNLVRAIQSIYGLPEKIAQEALDRSVLIDKGVEYATGEQIAKETMMERTAKSVDPEAVGDSLFYKIVGYNGKRLLKTLPLLAKASERATKLTAFEVFKTSKKGYTPDQIDIMTRYAASPPFQLGGTAVPVMNQYTVFANSIIQGARADAYFFKKDPVGFIAMASVPMVLSAIAATFYAASKNPELKQKLKDMGVPGVDYVADAMLKMNPLHRRNNLNMPIGKRDDGTVDYFSMPLPNSIKILNNIIMTMAEKKDYAKIFAGIGGILANEMPSPSPFLSTINVAMQMRNSKPPVDWQTGLPIMPEDVWRDKGTPFLKSMFANVWNQFLYGSIYRMETDPTRYRDVASKQTNKFVDLIKKVTYGSMVKNSGAGADAALYEAKENAIDRRASATVAVGQIVKRALEEQDAKGGDINFTDQDFEAFVKYGVDSRFIKAEIRKGYIDRMKNADNSFKKMYLMKQALKNTPKSEQPQLFQDLVDQGYLEAK